MDALILPYLEQTQVYGKYDFSLGYSGVYAGANELVGGTRVAAYCCPSDTQDELLDIGTSSGGTPGGRILWYKCNVAGVTDTYDIWDSVDDNATDTGDGMLMALKAIRIAEVADGTSNTLFVGEVTGAGPGTKSGWQWVHFNLMNTGFGINQEGTLPGDGIYGKYADGNTPPQVIIREGATS